MSHISKFKQTPSSSRLAPLVRNKKWQCILCPENNYEIGRFTTNRKDVIISLSFEQKQKLDNCKIDFENWTHFKSKKTQLLT